VAGGRACAGVAPPPLFAAAAAAAVSAAPAAFLRSSATSSSVDGRQLRLPDNCSQRATGMNMNMSRAVNVCSQDND